MAAASVLRASSAAVAVKSLIVLAVAAAAATTGDEADTPDARAEPKSQPPDNDAENIFRVRDPRSPLWAGCRALATAAGCTVGQPSASGVLVDLVCLMAHD